MFNRKRDQEIVVMDRITVYQGIRVGELFMTSDDSKHLFESLFDEDQIYYALRYHLRVQGMFVRNVLDRKVVRSIINTNAIDRIDIDEHVKCRWANE
jgi:hypothetical protein